ncbi:MAG: SLC13 family permease [Candidatus Theseobacter exili]|nr:SLC13 family permease [Candidatus Theseobacter exili]
MVFAGYFTIAVLLAMVVCLLLEFQGPAVVFSFVLGIFILSGIITPQEALSGFSNQGVMIIALLFVVAEGIRRTGVLNTFIGIFLKEDRNGSVAKMIFKMSIPVTFLSAFLNNTPIVMFFTPIVKKWTERTGLDPSKFLIPLSYAAIFGGMCTLIGTSTNLVLHGMMIEKGLDGLSMFELAKVGIPCAIAGLFYLAYLGNKLLPSRKDILDEVSENRKEYVIELKILHNCPLIGKTIQSAGLRNLKNVFLLEVEREGESLAPVTPDEIIQENDRMMFVGITSAIVELQEIRGLVPAAHEMFNKDFSKISSQFVEVVVSHSSPILGKTVRDVEFRSRYNAGVVAVHRNGERIISKIGDIKLHAGDTLLLLTTKEFSKKWYNSSDFYLVSTVKVQDPEVYNKAYIAGAILLAMVGAVAFRNYLPIIGGRRISMLFAAIAAVALMLITGCVNIVQARRAVKLDIIITIACAIGISKVLDNSGISSTIADWIVLLTNKIGPLGILSVLYICTALLAALISNIAAITMMFPIALSAATQMELAPKPFLIAILIAAVSSFATPTGYMTNLIVQGAGGYKYKDYVKVGIPLNLLFFLIGIFLIPFFWPF